MQSHGPNNYWILGLCVGNGHCIIWTTAYVYIYVAIHILSIRPAPLERCEGECSPSLLRVSRTAIHNFSVHLISHSSDRQTDRQIDSQRMP